MPWNEVPLSPCLEFDPQNTIDWPSDPEFGAPSGFGSLVLADLDGDQDPDAAIVVDGIPVALWKIALYSAPERIRFPTQPDPSAVRSIAALPGAGPDGRDALALTDARGLYLVNYANQTFEDPLLLDESAWRDAAPIHADDLDGDQDLDLLGIAADGRTILTLLNTPDGFVPGLSIIEPLPVKDVVAMDWDGTPGRELIALSQRGLLVHAASGLQIAGVPWLSSSGCITRFRAADVESGELLAWTRASTSGSSELVVRSKTISEGPWPLSFDFCGSSASITPIALLSGNYDGDANDELLLVHTENETAVMLANRGAAGPPPPGQALQPHFAPGNDFAHDILPLAPFPGTPGQVGIPAFGQVDGVDSDDVVFPVASTGKVEVFLQLPFQRALNLTSGGSNSAEVVSERTEFGPDPHADNHLRLGLTIPPRYADSTHLDLIVWEQLGPVAMHAVSSDAVYHRRHPLLTSGGTVTPQNQWVDVEFDFPAFGAPGECWNESDKPNYFTEYRFVRVAQGSGAETKSKAFTGGFTLETCGVWPTNYSHLILQGIPGTKFDLYQHNGLTTGAESRNVLGLYVPMNSQPAFASGSNPNPGPRWPGGWTLPFLDQ